MPASNQPSDYAMIRGSIVAGFSGPCRRCDNRSRCSRLLYREVLVATPGVGPQAVNFGFVFVSAAAPLTRRDSVPWLF